MTYDPLDADADPFKPPAIPTEVACLHCQKEYDSYLIEWRVEPAADGSPHGFWCCPTPGCDGKGFCFDIFPTDPDYQFENGGWIHDDSEEDEEDLDEDLDETNEPGEGATGNGKHQPNDDVDDIPF